MKRNHIGWGGLLLGAVACAGEPADPAQTGTNGFYLVEPLESHSSRAEQDGGVADSGGLRLPEQGLRAVGQSGYRSSADLIPAEYLDISLELYSWTPSGGTQPLGPMPGEDYVAMQLLDASSDLDVLFTYAASLDAGEFYLWTDEGGFEPLPAPFASAGTSSVELSDDGALVVAGFWETSIVDDGVPVLPAYDIARKEYAPILLPEDTQWGRVLYVGPDAEEVLGYAEGEHADGTYFRWTPDGGTEDLGAPGGCSQGFAQGTDRGGLLFPNCDQPYAHIPDAGWVALSEGDPPPAGTSNVVDVASRDGTMLSGYTLYPDLVPYGAKILWRYDEERGFELGDIQNGDPELISADGSIIVGIHSDTLLNSESSPFLWRKGEAPLALPLLDGAISCYPLSMTDDAELIVGTCWYGPENPVNQAAIWHDEEVEPVRDWLADRGVDVGTAELRLADIDEGGTRLYGTATVGDEDRGWIAELD